MFWNLESGYGATRNSHLAIYDASAHVLVSGNVVYPGRLYTYVKNAAQFAASFFRLAA